MRTINSICCLMETGLSFDNDLINNIYKIQNIVIKMAYIAEACLRLLKKIFHIQNWKLLNQLELIKMRLGVVSPKE